MCKPDNQSIISFSQGGYDVSVGCESGTYPGRCGWNTLTADEARCRDTWMALACGLCNRINVIGLRIPVASNWNLQLFSSLCTSSSDREVLQYLTFGWPLNREHGPVSKTWFNHQSANRHPECIDRYLAKELSHGSMLGPFDVSPFHASVTGISPMSTRPKKEPGSRRVIVDLSWPPDGNSVNSLIPKDSFLRVPTKLRYPTIDDICRRAFQLGPGVKGWKKDVSRAFRQVPLDPAWWSFLGVCWRNKIYFDKAAVMGCRSAPYTMQRVTNSIRHFMSDICYVVFNYVDDFMSVDWEDAAWRAYNTMGNLLRDLGVQEAVDKSVPPSHLIEFLGILFDLIRMLIILPQDKCDDIRSELRQWRHVQIMTLNGLQSLAGKLQFAATCVRPGRVFVAQLYDAIGEMEQEGVSQMPITDEVIGDILWWETFMQQYNGYSIMWMQQLELDSVFATDACLTGIGRVCGDEYFRAPITSQLRQQQNLNIAQLEMLAVYIAISLWGQKYTGVKFAISCDNQVVVKVINKGRSSNLTPTFPLLVHTY